MNKNAYLSQLKALLAGLSETDVQEILSDYEMHFQYAYEEGLSDEAIIESLGPVESVANQYIQLEPMENNATPMEDEIIESEIIESEIIESEIIESEIMEEASIDNRIIDLEPINMEIVPTIKSSQNSSSSEDSKKPSGINGHQTHTGYSVQNKGRSAAGSFVIAMVLIFLNLTFILGPFIALWGVWFSFFMVGVALVGEGIKMIVLTSTVNDYSAGLSEVTLIAQIGFYMTFGGCVTLLMVKLAKAFGLLTKKYILWNVKLVKGEA